MFVHKERLREVSGLEWFPDRTGFLIAAQSAQNVGQSLERLIVRIRAGGLDCKGSSAFVLRIIFMFEIVRHF